MVAAINSSDNRSTASFVILLMVSPTLALPAGIDQCVLKGVTLVTAHTLGAGLMVEHEGLYDKITKVMAAFSVWDVGIDWVWAAPG